MFREKYIITEGTVVKQKRRGQHRGLVKYFVLYIHEKSSFQQTGSRLTERQSAVLKPA